MSEDYVFEYLHMEMVDHFCKDAEKNDGIVSSFQFHTTTAVGRGSC